MGDECGVAPVEGKQVLRSVGDFLERGGKKKNLERLVKDAGVRKCSARVDKTGGVRTLF